MEELSPKGERGYPVASRFIPWCGRGDVGFGGFRVFTNWCWGREEEESKERLTVWVSKKSCKGDMSKLKQKRV